MRKERIIDPFEIKNYDKWHPRRVFFTAKARYIEFIARKKFQKYQLPEKIRPEIPYITDNNIENTAVTAVQLQYLLRALEITEHYTDTVVVEIGSYRGVTTKALAKSSSRTVIAVDPYSGYGGNQEDYKIFFENIKDFPNIIHKPSTSGETARNWAHGPISFIFIDAVHDYVNTSYDIFIWSAHLISGGVLALHDTDRCQFAGTRKAAFECYQKYSLFAHPTNLTIFIKDTNVSC